MSDRSIPSHMRAVEITAPGGPSVLKVRNVKVPSPSENQILIKIAYAGVNRPDALQRAGLYAPPKDASPIPGLEASGTIVAMGKGVTRWKIGDQVTALLPGGGYSEYAVTESSHALVIPRGIGLKEAACLPETCFTVWSNVVMRGNLKSGERFLVHGGSSGIGTTAIQIARNIGATVYATAGSDEKIQICQKIGAQTALNYHTDDWQSLLKEQGGMDLILDMVGGDYLPKNIKTLADDGRLVQIAFLKGASVELNFAQVMMRRLTITGSTLRPQSNQAKSIIAQEVEANVWPMITKGQFHPIIDSEFPLEEANLAHQHMESSSHIGKIVLQVGIGI